MGTRFTETKPCDIIACSTVGVFVAIESKQIKKWCSLTRKMLRENQISALDKVVKNKGKAYLLLNIRIKKTAKAPKENWCVVFNWKEHRKNILSNKYTVAVLKEGYVGDWKQAFIIEKKIHWHLSDL